MLLLEVLSTSHLVLAPSSWTMSTVMVLRTPSGAVKPMLLSHTTVSTMKMLESLAVSQQELLLFYYSLLFYAICLILQQLLVSNATVLRAAYRFLAIV